jgi:uridine kinase
MKAGLSAAGVTAVKTACRNKYPSKAVEAPSYNSTPNPFDKFIDPNYVPPSCNTIDLTNEEIRNIKLQPDVLAPTEN